jgi:hypothetical protein
MFQKLGQKKVKFKKTAGKHGEWEVKESES